MEIIIKTKLDYKAIIESAPDLYLILSPQFDIVEVSNAYLAATLVKRDDVIGRNIFDVFPDNPNDANATGVNNLRDSLTRALKEKVQDTMAVQKYDIRLPAEEGGDYIERFWSPINSPVMDKNNKVIYIIHRAEDVTEFVRHKKLTEELKSHVGQMEAEILRRSQELQDANNRLRKLNEKFVESEMQSTLLIDATKEYAIMMLDPQGYINTWNKGAEFIKGFKAYEIIGKHFSHFFIPQEIAQGQPEKELAIALKQGYFENEEWRVRKNGEHFWASVIIRPIYNKHGKLLGFGKITRDLTERKRIETAKEEFISVVSHELRTPLTSIQGAVSLLLGGAVGPINEKIKKLLNIAENNCHRLLRLVNDILDISKLEANKMVFEMKPIVLEKLITETMDANQAYAEKYGITLYFSHDAPSNNLIVRADNGRLMQVLTNLISNAVKFSKRDAVVTISITKKNQNVRVSVADTGRGIPEEFHHKIFEKFSQVDATDSRREYGSGLGLSISKAIIEYLGGKLDFTSKVNEGSTFYFDLPIDETSQVE